MKTFIALTVVGGMLASSAFAQSGIGGIIEKSGLSPKDMTIMGEAARQLYDGTTPQVGASADWSNPESKSHGVAKLLEVSGNCVVIQQLSHPKGQADPFEYRTRQCRNADGKWVLQP